MTETIEPVTKLVYEMPALSLLQFWKVYTEWVHDAGHHKIVVELREWALFGEDKLLECGEIEADTDPTVNSVRAVRVARMVLDRYKLRTRQPAFDNLEGCKFQR